MGSQETIQPRVPLIPGQRYTIWGVLVLVMDRCSYCGRETELYEGGTPVCVPCSDASIHPEPTIHIRLIEELAEATAEHSAATAAYNRVMWETPSAIPHPDGVQRIHSISRELSVAKKRLASAHSRLTDFLDTGIIPEDLLRD
jgi:hypothetical protein